MEKVIGVRFINSNRIYYFSPDGFELNVDDEVIVNTEKGEQFGKVCTDIFECNDANVSLPLKQIIRKATDEDIMVYEQNCKLCNKALKDARRIANSQGLDMNIINASVSFDKTQIIFNFIADNRVDFRELAKKLASIYKMRIELRQIGVRDKAKSVGGLGPCGRVLCCSSFLNDFDSVTINMAKNQFIALNPTKINGSCGRLLCCLTYEDSLYTEMKKNFLPVGSYIDYMGEKCKISGINLFKGSYNLEKSDKSIVEVSLDEYEASK